MMMMINNNNSCCCCQRTTCCKKSITLLTSDEAGHANNCVFLQDSMSVTTGKVSQGKVSPNTKQSLTMTSSPVQRSSRATWFGLTLQGETITVPPRELQDTTYSPLNANSHLEGVTREQVCVWLSLKVNFLCLNELTKRYVYFNLTVSVYFIY